MAAKREHPLIKKYKGPVIDRTRGLVIGDGLELLKQSIRRLCFTQKGTRMGNLEYGTNIPNLPFSNDWEGLQRRIAFEISEGLAKWEPRAELTSVEIIAIDGSRVNFLIRFVESETREAGTVPIDSEFVE